MRRVFNKEFVNHDSEENITLIDHQYTTKEKKYIKSKKWYRLYEWIDVHELSHTKIFVTKNNTLLKYSIDNRGYESLQKIDRKSVDNYGRERNNYEIEINYVFDSIDRIKKYEKQYGDNYKTVSTTVNESKIIEVLSND